MINSAIGTTKGFDDLYPKNVSVTNEMKTYGICSKE